MANLAEQACRADGSPAPWLAKVSKMAVDSARYSDHVPPIFNSGTFLLDTKREKQLIERYLTYTSGSVNVSGADFGELASIAPCLPEPLIWLGLITLSTGDAQAASLLGSHALAAMKSFGVAWDRRLSYRRWFDLVELLVYSATVPLRDLVSLASAVFETLEGYKSLAMLYEELSPLLQTSQNHDPILGDTADLGGYHHASSPASDGIPKRFLAYIAGFRGNVRGKSRRMTLYPELSSRAFYEPASFPLATALEKAAPEILGEFFALDRSDFHRESENIARQGEWDIMMLLERGRLNEQNCRACPTTIEALLANGCMQGLSGLAYFSRLAPGTKIAAHRGPTNMRLRCHLGIKIPERAALKVDGIERSWIEGKCLIFNDALEHEAWNLGEEERIVLVVDLWHPDLTGTEVQLLEGLQRYAFSHAENLTNYWRKNESAREKGSSDALLARVR